ncbi:MAG: hypothetical protein M3Z33_12155 [Actinomycetota bacterium]|nr:hypothetical protein [Actinomycetota bacterium]
MLRPGLLALLCALAVGASGIGSSAAAAEVSTPPFSGPRVVLAFLPARERPPKVPPTAGTPPDPQEMVQARIDQRKMLSLGVLGATQGPFTQEQMLLDMTAGTRTSAATYATKQPWPMRLSVAGTAGFIDGWLPNKRRALLAPASIKPGLLAKSIPGGGTYVGFSSVRGLEAAAAADEQGTVCRVSIGPGNTVAFRTEQLLARHRFVVVSLPPKQLGGIQLDTLLRDRHPDEAVIVMQAPPAQKAPQLLPVGIVGTGGDAKPGGLSSQSTRQAGFVTGIDVAPTILERLGMPVPSDMRGEPITISGRRDSKALDDLRFRFTNIGKYRLTTVQGMILSLLAVVLAMAAFGGWHRSFRKGLRIGALACMWAPTVVLFEALFNPTASGVEMAIVAVPSFLLAFLTNRFVRWPIAPVVPMFAALGVYTFDLVNDSHLIVRSLLGPNPKFGSRFFGIGNELEGALPVMMFIGVGAALTGKARSRGTAAVFAVAGLVLAGIIGSGRLGADVGGVMTVGAGAAVATLLMLPKRPSKWIILAAGLAPLLAVAALAGLDIVTGGNGHFTRNVLNQSSGNFSDVILRRLELAFNALFNGRRMPYVVTAGAIAVGFAYRNRAWLYGPVPDPAWRAALLGGLASSVGGSFFNDSGPLLFVVGAFGLVVATMYIQGDPRLAPGDQKMAELREEVPAEGRPPPREGKRSKPQETEGEPSIVSPAAS